MLDTDETLAALQAGLIDDGATRRAFERTFAAIDGIAAARHNVDAWLATQGVRLTW